MGVRDWHSGQVVLLWVGTVWAEVVSFLLFSGMPGDPYDKFLEFASVVLPFVSIAPTWQWFDARRKGGGR